MKIAVNTRFLLKNRLEGIGGFTFEVLKRLVKAHPADQFFFLFDRAFDPSFVFAENITPIVVTPPARHPLLFYWWFEWSIPRVLKKHKVDVFCSPDNFCSLRTTVPTVLVMHDLAYLHFPAHFRPRDLRYYQKYTPKFVQRANQIVSVSNFTKQDLLQHFQISSAQIAVACNGCKPLFQPLQEVERQYIRATYANGKPYFFYVGAVHPRKNVHRLIQAFDQFKSQTNAPHQLLIAGRFRWQTGVVKTAYDQAVHQSAIHFLGYVEETLLAQLMASAFALTYVSLFEGFGVPLLEAMHCEVPVVTSNRASMPEIVGDAARLIEPEDITDIANALIELYQSAHKRQQLVALGKQQRTKFSWERASAVVYDTIEKVATLSSERRDR